MNTHEYVISGQQRLGRRRVLAIENARDTVLYVWRGTLWITQQDDPQDRIVPAGGWIRLDRPGRALVQALEHAQFSVTALRADRSAGWLERLRERLSGAQAPASLVAH